MLMHVKKKESNLKGAFYRMSKPVLTATKRNDEHVFSEDIEKGDYGELLAKKFFREFNGINLIEDKSGVYEYQKADVDLLVEARVSGGSEVLGIEVKNDTTTYPNMFFETKSVIKNGKVVSPGCLLVSEADFLIYIYQAYDVAVFVPLKNLNNWVVDYLKSGRLFGKGPVTNKGYKGEGYKVPVRALAGKDGFKKVRRLQFRDLKTTEPISFEEFERRRLWAKNEIDGKRYAELNLKEEEGWEEININLYPNKNQLDMPLMSIPERNKKARLKLDYLESFYGKKVNWK